MFNAAGINTPWLGVCASAARTSVGSCRPALPPGLWCSLSSGPLLPPPPAADTGVIHALLSACCVPSTGSTKAAMMGNTQREKMKKRGGGGGGEMQLVDEELTAAAVRERGPSPQHPLAISAPQRELVLGSCVFSRRAPVLTSPPAAPRGPVCSKSGK